MALLNGSGYSDVPVAEPPPVTATDVPPSGGGGGVMSWLVSHFGGGDLGSDLPKEATRQSDPYANQVASSSGKEFQPAWRTGGGMWGDGGIIGQEAYRALEEGQKKAYDELALIGFGKEVPGMAAGLRQEGRIRNLANRPGPRRSSAGYETVEDPNAPEPPPQFGLGHNDPPEPIWMAKGGADPAQPVAAKGARQANPDRLSRAYADADLAKIGLPALEDVRPSTNTGPVTPEQIQAGVEHVVKPGQVMDLSETYKVPLVPQIPLDRIDPNEGKRRGLPDYIVDAVNDQELRGKLRFIAEEGLKVGGAYWYNADPLRQAFMSELGPAEGDKQFKRYMTIVGAVSAGSNVAQNIRTGSYYLNRERAGFPVRGEQDARGRWKPMDLENPYGHKMQDAQFNAYRDIEGGVPLSSTERPKRASFDENLGGNQEAFTIDKHNMRIIGMLKGTPDWMMGTVKADAEYPDLGIKKGDSVNWKQKFLDGDISMERMMTIPSAWVDVPKKNHYGALEAMQKDIAREMGVSPAQFQAALWVGGGRITGLRSLPTSFLGAFETRLQRTAQARGNTPLEALREFIRGGRPLLTPLAVAGAGSAFAIGGGGDDNKEQ
jgi:hypothetical protein